jgi:hypothetical protein
MRRTTAHDELRYDAERDAAMEGAQRANVKRKMEEMSERLRTILSNINVRADAAVHGSVEQSSQLKPTEGKRYFSASEQLGSNGRAVADGGSRTKGDNELRRRYESMKASLGLSKHVPR